MKKEELIKAYAYAENLWGTFKPSEDELKLKMQNQLWYDALKNYPLEVVYAGMREFARKSDFVNIMKISEECQTIILLLQNNNEDEDKIFLEIDKAVCSGDKTHAFNNLSPVAQRVVGTPSKLYAWALCECCEFDTVIASNIKRSIKNQLATQKKVRNLQRENSTLLVNVEFLKISNSEA